MPESEIKNSFIQRLELIAKIGSFTAKVSITMGILLSLIYCCFVGFYPRNIDVGDGLFFIWVSLAFGFFYTVVIFIFGSISFSFYRFALKFVPKRFKKGLPNISKPSDYTNVHLFSGLFVFAFLLAWILSGMPSDGSIDSITKIASIAAAAFMSGFSIAVLLEDEDENKPRKLKHKLIFILAIFIIPSVVIQGFFKNTLFNSMEHLGVRASNVSIYLDKDYAAALIDDLRSIPNLEIKWVGSLNNKLKISNVAIEFQGIGDVNLVKLCPKETCPSMYIPANLMTTTENFPKNELKPLAKRIIEINKEFFKSSGITFNEQSLEFSFSNLYGIYKTGNSLGSETNVAIQLELLSRLAPVMSEYKDDIKSFEIRGYSSSEWKSSEDSLDAYIRNLELSHNRAFDLIRAIKEHDNLLAHLNWLVPKLVYSGYSSSSKNEKAIDFKITLNVSG